MRKAISSLHMHMHMQYARVFMQYIFKIYKEIARQNNYPMLVY